MQDSICFCVQEPAPFRDSETGIMVPRDLSSASRYGRIEFLLDQNDKPSYLPGPSLWKVNNRLKFFNPERDYLFTAGGDPVAMGMAFALLSAAGFRSVNFLRWERERNIDGQRVKGAGYYVPVKIKLRFYEGEAQDEPEQPDLFE